MPRRIRFAPPSYWLRFQSATNLLDSMEIVKLVEAQRPMVRETTLTEAPCPCGSPLKYKRCCGNPVTQANAA